MRISCVITCYNQERTIAQAVHSLLGQSRQPDEIVVADDGSTDGSRELIRSLAANHAIITPVFRDRNLGVTVNRDLAVRQTDGDFVTTLDGDDSHLPEKLAGESAAIEKTNASVAYSDLRIVQLSTGETRFEELSSFAALGTRDRVRWIMARRTHVPRDMLVAKELHMRIGGYRPEGQPYEDWDYKIRVAAAADSWAYSGVEGVVHHLHAGGISQIPFVQHGVKRLIVIRSNRDLIRAQAGSAFYVGMILFTIAWTTKWQAKSWFWAARRRIRELRMGAPPRSH